MHVNKNSEQLLPEYDSDEKNKNNYDSTGDEALLVHSASAKGSDTIKRSRESEGHPPSYHLVQGSGRASDARIGLVKLNNRSDLSSNAHSSGLTVSIVCSIVPL